MMSALSSITGRSPSVALVSSAAASSVSLRSRCSLLRSEAAAISISVASMVFQVRPPWASTIPRQTARLRPLLVLGIAILFAVTDLLAHRGGMYYD